MRRTIIAILIALVVGAGIGVTGMWGVNHYRSHVERAHTEKEKTDEALAEYTLWLMAFTGILAFATIGLGAATIGLYLTGEKQVAITTKALIGDQRAWLTTKLELGNEGLRIKDGRIELDARLKVSNLGRTPAINAHTNMLLVENDDPEAIAKFAADNKIDHPHSLFVSPGDFYVRPWLPTLSEQDASTRAAGMGIQPVLFGCVTYRILQDSELHQVVFVYLLGQKNGSPWGDWFQLTQDAQYLPEDIVISPWAGGFAT